LQLSGELIYGVDEGSSTHGMAEPEMTEHGDLRQLNPRGTETSVLGWTSVDGILGVGISI
jgi:hypothetical protein